MYKENKSNIIFDGVDFFVVSLLGGIQTVQADAQSTVKTAVSDECGRYSGDVVYSFGR